MEKLNCDVLPIEASANPIEGSESEMALQSCSKPGKGSRPLYSNTDQSLDIKSPQESRLALNNAALSVRSDSQRAIKKQYFQDCDLSAFDLTGGLGGAL